MLNLTVPDYWTDLIWMKNRGTLFDRLSSKEDLLIDFKQCNWIDLQPLCDLLLQLSLRTSNSRRTFLQLEQRYPRSLNRVTRFLLETGFVGYLAERLPEEWITVIRGDSQQSLPEFVKFAQECSMPEPLLNYETILPCSIVEIESDMSRESIFADCKGFIRQMGISRRLPSVRAESKAAA